MVHYLSSLIKYQQPLIALVKYWDNFTNAFRFFSTLTNAFRIAYTITAQNFLKENNQQVLGGSWQTSITVFTSYVYNSLIIIPNNCAEIHFNADG